MTLTEKIQSLQQGVGASYKKPDLAKLEDFKKALWNEAITPPALEYLRKDRNLADGTIKHFNLGYDAEREAIAIPIFKRGELINIKYRFLSPESKAKYGQEKDCEVWLYNEEGIQDGIKKGGVLVVEGEFDLMSVWQAGLTNVVSPASGKDSYGIWIELLDNIPKVFLAYDNDKPGRETSMKFAERVGVEKCVEVLYPVDIKDANDYFKKFTSADYRELLKAARPFYRYQFKGLAEIIEDFRNNKTSKLQLKHLPGVKIGDDWVIVVTGETNVGKTSYVMNLAHELAERSIPTLVLPFERGPEAVGLRYLMVANSLEEDEFKSLNNEEWDDVIKNTVNLPLYFAMPKKDETVDLIKKAKRIFGVQVVIVDHFNLMVRNAMGKENENVVVERSLQELKRLGQDEKIIHILVHHLKKADNTGGVRKERTMDDF